MGLELLQIDAFVAGPLRGNPAAVCFVEADADDRWMQAVAAEMNLSETAFVGSRADTGFGLRWFTPTTEVPLCGHATLAAAHAVVETGRAPAGRPITFHTASGPLVAHTTAGSITIDLPASPVEGTPVPTDVVAALRIASEAAVTAARTPTDRLLVVTDATTVRAVAPDFPALAGTDARGVIVTARSDDAEFDVISRYFAPAVGIDEDPVTGAAHCVLAPWWAKELGRDRLRCLQASSRGGALDVTVTGDRVHLTGAAVTVLRGDLLM